MNEGNEEKKPEHTPKAKTLIRFLHHFPHLPHPSLISHHLTLAHPSGSLNLITPMDSPLVPKKMMGERGEVGVGKEGA